MSDIIEHRNGALVFGRDVPSTSGLTQDGAEFLAGVYERSRVHEQTFRGLSRKLRGDKRKVLRFDVVAFGVMVGSALDSVYRKGPKPSPFVSKT